MNKHVIEVQSTSQLQMNTEQVDNDQTTDQNNGQTTDQNNGQTTDQSSPTTKQGKMGANERLGLASTVFNPRKEKEDIEKLSVRGSDKKGMALHFDDVRENTLCSTTARNRELMINIQKGKIKIPHGNNDDKLIDAVCIFLLQGLETEDISMILDISIGRAKTLRKNAIEKLPKRFLFPEETQVIPIFLLFAAISPSMYEIVENRQYKVIELFGTLKMTRKDRDGNLYLDPRFSRGDAEGTPSYSFIEVASYIHGKLFNPETARETTALSRRALKEYEDHRRKKNEPTNKTPEELNEKLDLLSDEQKKQLFFILKKMGYDAN